MITLLRVDSYLDNNISLLSTKLNYLKYVLQGLLCCDDGGSTLTAVVVL